MLKVDVKLLRLDFLGGHVKKSFKCVTSTVTPTCVGMELYIVVGPHSNCTLWVGRIFSARDLRRIQSRVARAAPLA
jgi:hypothetical protein